MPAPPPSSSLRQIPIQVDLQKFLRMGLVMDEPAAKVSEEEMSEYSDSSEDEYEQSLQENVRRAEASVLKYRGRSWPEVVGLDAEEAERIIKEGEPELWFEVQPETQLLTMCYVTCRVRLIVDQHNRVVRTPRVG